MSTPNYKELVENLSDWVWEVNSQAVYTYCSPKVSDFLGYTPQEVVGKTPFHFMSEAEAQRVGELFGSFVSKQENFYQIENINIHKDGHEVILETSGIALFDDEGVWYGYRGIDRDVTKVKEEEKAARQRLANEVEKNRQNEAMMLYQSRLAQMGEMMSMIAHQWRQPLASITAITSNIYIKNQLGKVELDPFVEEQALKIDRHVQFLSQTINDFRSFFHEDKEKELIDVREAIEKSLNIIKGSLEYNEIDLQMIIEDDLRFKSFKNEFTHVILNLIKNAEDVIVERKIKNAEIIIRAYDEGEYMHCEIEDNAGGIYAQHQDKIFEPYFTTKNILNGTGLGLYMSKIIIEKHCQGRLYVQNGNKGACFTMDVPKNVS